MFPGEISKILVATCFSRQILQEWSEKMGPGVRPRFDFSTSAAELLIFFGTISNIVFISSNYKNEAKNGARCPFLLIFQIQLKN